MDVYKQRELKIKAIERLAELALKTDHSEVAKDLDRNERRYFLEELIRMGQSLETRAKRMKRSDEF